MNTEYTYKQTPGVGIGSFKPSGTISFHSGLPTGTKEIMRISKDGIWVNPDIPVDEVPKAVLDAMDSQIKYLVQKAVEAEREACAELAAWVLKMPNNDVSAYIRLRSET